MAGMPLDTATLLAVALEGIVYGFSILMFIGTIWSLTYKQRTQDINRPMIVVAILLLILSTGHIIATFIRVDDGLVKYRDTYPGGPAAFFADPTQKTLAIMHAFYVLQTLLADGVVIYRCYIVWQSVWIIILPSLLWCSVAVTGTGFIYSFLEVTSDSGDIFANMLGGPAQWVTAFFTSTMATNGLSSGLLAYRIWMMIERNVSTAHTTKGDSMMPIVRMLVDAAVLYTVVLLITLIFFLCSNNGEQPVLDMLTPIMSIAFYMVLIRIAINRQKRTPSTNEAELSTLQFPVHIHISKYTRNDGTLAYGIGNEDQPSTLRAESRNGSLQS